MTDKFQLKALLSFRAFPGWRCMRPRAGAAFGAALFILPGVTNQSFALIHWAYTSAPDTNWGGIASSADGTKYVAVGEGGIYTSANAGTTWIQTSAPITNWTSVASSSDGTTLVAGSVGNGCLEGGPIYVSTNSGTTWTKTSAPMYPWWDVACSADGRRIIATAPLDPLGQGTTPFLSANAGVSWTAASLPATNEWRSVACSADGRKMVAATGSSLIFTSTNAGASWAMAEPTHWANYVSLSADGRILVAVGYRAAIYVSTNLGTTWTVTPVGWESGSAAVSSADGRMWMITGGASLDYSSTNYAMTWDCYEDWQSGPVASSADWSKLVSIRGSHIFTSFITSPLLSISSARDAVVLSWPWYVIDFALQATPALATSNWTDVVATPSFTNGQYRVILPATNGGRLFRLLHP